MRTLISSRPLRPFGLRAFAVALTAGGASTQAQVGPPVVSNLHSEQRPGTQLVDIGYDLDSLFSEIYVTLEISSDGGGTWSVPAASASGDLGVGVSPGAGKTIAWDAGADWPGRFSDRMRFRVAADDLAELELELFRVNEEPDDPEAITIESEHEAITLYGEKANGADFIDLRQAVYATTEGEVIDIEFEDWFPSVMMIEGWAFVLSSWGIDTVDVTIFPPGEDAIFIADLPFNPNAIAAFKAAADGASLGLEAEASESATHGPGGAVAAMALTNEQLRDVGEALTAASWAVTTGKCAGGIGAALLSKGVATPLAFKLCAPLAVKAVAKASGSSTVSSIATGFGIAACIVEGSALDCASTVLEVAGTSLTWAADRRELFLSVQTGVATGSVESHTGQAAAGTYVQAVRRNGSGDTVIGTARVGADGKYSIRIPANTPADFVFSGPGGVAAILADITAIGGAKVDAPLVQMPSDEGAMVRIPAGWFTMGRTSGDTDSTAPPVSVYVSEFYIGRYPVTKALWDQVRSWALLNGYNGIAAGGGKDSSHPVQSISWWHMVRWCNARSEMEGLTPVYTRGGEVIRDSSSTIPPDGDWSPDANGYRLPTEAEWEKAARGGIAGKRFPSGSDVISHTHANFRNNGGESFQFGTTDYHPYYAVGEMPFTNPVSDFPPNGYGLYGTGGNVSEQCWDRYGASYYSQRIDPRGPNQGTLRVFRGGAWSRPASASRCASRNARNVNEATQSVGFRAARGSVP